MDIRKIRKITTRWIGWIINWKIAETKSRTTTQNPLGDRFCKIDASLEIFLMSGPITTNSSTPDEPSGKTSRHGVISRLGTTYYHMIKIFLVKNIILHLRRKGSNSKSLMLMSWKKISHHHSSKKTRSILIIVSSGTTQ